MIAPKISIKGSQFRIVNKDEETALDDSIDVVIVGANPKLSKSWYAEEWSEDSQSSTPDCYSLDGMYPSKNSHAMQNDMCVSCSQNAWGSRTTPTGNKVKACVDQKRLAVVLANGPFSEAYLLQVTPASLKNLNAYQKELSMRGIAPEIVRTRISFDTLAAFPKLRFSFRGFNSDTDQKDVDEHLGTKQTRIVTGELAVETQQSDHSLDEYGFVEEDGFILTNET
jgi:hypothetical protein